MPQNNEDSPSSYLKSLFTYKGGFIFGEKYVPFWFRALIGCLDVLGPETDADLERVSQRLCNASSYGDLHKLWLSTIDEIISLRGAHYTHGKNTIDLKYMMITDLLGGVRPEQFDGAIWAQYHHFALEDELDYEDHQQIIDARLRKAIEGVSDDN